MESHDFTSWYLAHVRFTLRDVPVAGSGSDPRDLHSGGFNVLNSEFKSLRVSASMHCPK